MVEVVEAMIGRQGAGLGKRHARPISRPSRGLGEQERPQRSRRQEYDLPVGKMRGKVPGDIGLSEGRRRADDQLGAALRCFVQHVFAQIDGQKHAAHRMVVSAWLDEQADVVPGLGVSKGGQVLQHR